jgi:hypothetical protein
MPSDHTLSKIDRGLAKLRAAQALGQAPQPGEISLEGMARWCGVSEPTYRAYERSLLAKAFKRLSALGLPPHLATKTPAFLKHHQS